MKQTKILLPAAAVLMICCNAAMAQSEIYNFITIAGDAGYGSVDGTNSTARFWNPLGIAVDSAGTVYVADSRNYAIRELTQHGTNWVSSTISGSVGYDGSADGTNGDARFFYPNGVAADNGGNLYVADTEQSTIRKLTSMGTNWVSSTIAGKPWTIAASDGANGDAHFNRPAGVAVDSSGNVYVADAENNMIHKLTPVGTNWVTSTIGGLPAAWNNGTSDGTNGESRFYRPLGIAVDRGGNVYVADTGNCTIRKLTPIGTNWVTSTIAGLAREQGGGPDSRDGTNTAARFSFPSGVSVDNAGNIYVADSGNSTIRKLTQVGTNWITSTIAGLFQSTGRADGTNSAARFWNPSGIAVDKAGNVFVADTDNNTIREGLPLGVAPSAPIFQAIMQTNGMVTFTWSSISGRRYQVQYSSDLTQTNWGNVADPITATSETLAATDALGLTRQRSYRIVLLP